MVHLTSDIFTALTWALVHSLWQGLLLFMLMRILLAIIPGRYAAARYTAAVASLLLLITGFVVTIIYYYNIGLPSEQYNFTASQTQVSSAVAGAHVAIEGTGVMQPLSSWFNTHTVLIVCIYLAGMALLLVRITYNLFTLHKLKLNSILLPGADWQLMLNKCRSMLGINNKVRLYFSSGVLVPMVMGSIKPVILVPVALANKLSTTEAEAILLHELAHIRRHDYLVNMVQLFIETILFYNPFVWLISSVIRNERELCCDDIVVRTTTAPLPYAKALAALETFRRQPAMPALAATGNKHQLFNRIKRIMEMKNHNVNYGQLIAALLAIVLLAGTFTFFVPDVYAQSKKAKKQETTEKTEQSKTVKKHVIINSDVDMGDDDKTGKKQLQKSIVVVKNGDTVKNYNINKSFSETDEAIDEVFGMLEEMDLDDLIDDAMTKVDWKSTNDSVNVDIEINGEEISKDVRKAMTESRKAMAEARKEMAMARKEYTMAMAEARKEMAHARGQKEGATVMVFKSTDEGVDDDIYIRRTGEKVPVDAKIFVSSSHDKLLKSLEKDGLIDRKNGFKLVKKGDELYIDGIKQSKEVFKKYEPMMDMKNLTIKGNYRSININTRE